MKRFFTSFPVLSICLSVILVSQASGQFAQQGNKLVGSGAIGAASQGTSVALSSDGNTAIIGGLADDTSIGAAWVWIRSGSQWTQQQKLIGAGYSGMSMQGSSVALSSDGNTAIVGGSFDNSGVGAVWVWTRSNGIWTQQGAKLIGAGAVENAQQGCSVALSSDGNTALVGGYTDDGVAGATWVWTRSSGIWTQQGPKLVGTGAVGSSGQGIAVALSSDGNIALIGGAYDSSNVGAAWVFTRSSGVWTQQGTKLVGFDYSGHPLQGASISLSGDGTTAIIGGLQDNEVPTIKVTGAAWVWTRSGGTWTQQGYKLVGAGSGGFENQGSSISLSYDGNTAAIGGRSENGYGAVWVWNRVGTAWAQVGDKLVGTGVAFGSDQGGSTSLSSDGSTIITGGSFDSTYVGAVWVFYNHRDAKIASIRDLPGDQGGVATVNWNKSSVDRPTSTTVNQYMVWRGIRASSIPGAIVTNRKEYLQSIANHSLIPTTTMRIPSPENNAALADDIYWQYIATLPSHGIDHYSYACSTLADSTSQGIPWRYYFITAATADPNVYWDSAIDSGYSVDNIPPIAPQGGTINPLGGGPIQLAWKRDLQDPDVSHYAIYRSATSGFSPSPATLLATRTDTTFTDSSVVAGQSLYYRLTTVDVHGNQSSPTQELSAVALAVELASFTADPQRLNAMLNWTFATTVNLFGTEVQRKPANTTTTQDWEKVGFVQASTSPGGRYSFVDHPAVSGRYAYRLKVVHADGSSSFSASIELEVGLAPKVFTLAQNYPNPFNPSTTLEFTLEQNGRAVMKIYNVLGQEVATVFDQEAEAGRIYQAQFNASRFTSGVYMSVLESGGKRLLRKMLLVK